MAIGLAKAAAATPRTLFNHREDSVTKPDWGTKRECQNCGARFYDLKRQPITCPKCEAVFVPAESGQASARSKSAAIGKVAAPKPAAVESNDVETAAAGDAKDTEADDTDAAKAEEPDALIDDPAELGEDEDDLAVALDSKPEPEGDGR